MGCITTQTLLVAPGGANPSTLYAIAFGPAGDPVRLRGEDGDYSGLMFDLRHTFRLINVAPDNNPSEWRVSTAAYQYRLFDHLRHELLVWHWQPGDEFAGPDHPHIHVSAKLIVKLSEHDPAEVREIPLDNLHIATGRVSLESVIKTLIEDFAIRPTRLRRKNWRETLDRTEAVFRSERTRQP